MLPTQNLRAQDENIPNEFIFQVTLPPQWQIVEALFAYEQAGKYYLPIRELAEGFDFLADVDPDRKFATGFAGDEENSFTIDGQRGELVLKGQRQTIGPDTILTSDFLATDDLYVQLELLNQIWPVDMSIELSNLQIITTTETELPFVTKRLRLDKRKQVDARKAAQSARRTILPRQENPYQWFGKPIIDYQATYNFDTEEDNLTGSNVFNGVQHIGKLLAEFSANFALNQDREFDRPDNIRLKLSRKSVGEDYLVPGIRTFETGDVNLRQRQLIGNTENGRGIFVSNDNRNRFNEFDRITIEGNGPSGWDIEVFNNEELIDFGVVPENGQFFFEDFILNFGNNNVKILLFGPQGQVREELRTFTAGGNMLPPGELLYSAGILDADRSFILLDNAPRTTPRGVVKNADVSYGVNQWLTVFGNYTELPNNDEDRSYLTTGGVFSTPIGLVEAELYNEINGGNAAAFDYITTLPGNIRANFGLAFLNDFESEDAGFGGGANTFEATSQLNKSVKILGLPLGLRLNTTHTETEAGLPVTNVTSAQTLSRSGVRLTHSTNSQFRDFSHETTSGGFTTTVREGPWQLRGGVNYELHPLTELDSINGEVRYRTDDQFQAALTLGHNFQSNVYDIGFQLGHDFKTVLGSLESNYTRGGGWDFVLRATSSFNPFSPQGDYEFSSRQKRDFSPIRAQVFLDKDLDGEFNNDDEPLPDVKLGVGFGASQTETGENGIILANAPADRLTNFQIDKASLIDPYFVPSTKGFSTIPTKGSIIEASFPVIETGAVEGTIFRADNNRVVAGLTIDLLDANGEILNEAVTAFDGYYAFEFVKPGAYSIHAKEGQGADLLDNKFLLDPSDLFKFGNDLFLEIQGAEPKEPYGPFLEDIKAAAGEESEHSPFANSEALPQLAPIEVPAVETAPLTEATTSIQTGLYSLIKP